MRACAVLLALVAVVVLLVDGLDLGTHGDGAAIAADAPKTRFKPKRAMRDLRRQVEFGPRPAGSTANRRLTRWIARRFRGLGLRRVKVQPGLRNVIGRIPGRRRGALVVGAHHDTWAGDPEFVGANDGASGVAVLLGLARALPGRLKGPKIIFVAFDAEEARPGRAFGDDGARGSRKFVRQARRGGSRRVPRLKAIKAMILLDMVGDCDLKIPRELGSDRSLYRRIAAYGSSDVFGGSRDGAIDDDHTAFADAGVPAVDLIDFNYGPGDPPGAWWHTPEDTLERVCRRSLAAVGRPVERTLRAWRG